MCHFSTNIVKIVKVFSIIGSDAGMGIEHPGNCGNGISFVSITTDVVYLIVCLDNNYLT